ncbi:MAG: precorrin-6A reductase, partial [Blautia sp.]|nr:precorrin-6A reductase [Blautia sp.]
PEGVLALPGRLKREEMEAVMKDYGVSLVVDATHPYAVLVSENIRYACLAAGLPLLRILRPSQEGKGVTYVKDVAEAVEYLSSTHGNILLTTGSKELSGFTALPGYQERIYARILSLPPAIEEAVRLGLTGRHLIAMQGPFSQAMNEAILSQYDCSYLVTKDTGRAGGFLEKVEAARVMGVTCVVIGRPVEEEGLSLREARAFLLRFFSKQPEREITLLGMGMGAREGLTVEGEKALRSADLVVGSRRLLDSLDWISAEHYSAYRPEEIFAFLEEHPEYLSPVIVYSGDLGFYSGAKGLYALLLEKNIPCRFLPGLSSISAFFAKIGESYEDALLLSAHGKDLPLAGFVARNHKVFALLGKKGEVAGLCRALVDFGLGEVDIALGENLSYPEEKILKAKAREFCSYEGTPLSVLLAINPVPKMLPATSGLPDSAFLRGKVPMTKEEVRSVVLSKLSPSPADICYDVGAGTGSVSCELALRCPYGKVYALEREEAALSLLESNRRHFCLDNLFLVPGQAPETMTSLPPADVAFIGGSGGRLLEICRAILLKNKKTRLCIACVTLETLSEALRLKGLFSFASQEVVSLTISRARQLGTYQLMSGENPVTILVLSGAEKVEEEDEAS